MPVAELPPPWPGPASRTGLVSVVIPSHNRADVILETLASIEAQQYRPIEVIVVDDASDDATVAVVEGWAESHRAADFSVRCVVQTKSGAPTARNHGARLAAGDFIQFLDSDDLLLPEKLGSALSAMADPKLMFVSHDYSRFSCSPDTIVEHSRLSARSDDPAAHLLENRLHTLSAVYRRTVLRAVGPWCAELEIWQDTEFCLRVLLSGARGLWIPEVGALVRDSPGSIMNRGLQETWPAMLRSAEQMEAVAAEHRVLNIPFQSAMGIRLATISRRLAELGAWDESSRVFREAVGRMSGRAATKHRLHRVGVRVLGCRTMRRLGLM